MLLVAPATSYRTRAYLDAADAVGVDLAIASHGSLALAPSAARGISVDLENRERAVATIVESSRETPFDAVIASDDATVGVAAAAARALGLAHNPVDAVRAARRKDVARALLARAGVPVPRFALARCDGDPRASAAEVGYPCVIKPLAMAASRGVMRCDDDGELIARTRRLAAIVDDEHDPRVRGRMLVESFVPGVEIAIEALLEDGDLRVLAVFDKPDPLDGPFFEETYYVTPSRLAPERVALAARRLDEACRALGLRHGPVHAELRLDADEAWLIDLAARTIGGDCARLLGFGTGRNLEELVIENALGRAVAVRTLERGAGVLMIPVPRAGTLRRVEGVLAALAVPGVEDVVIAVREGYELRPLPEGGDYLGFVFATGPDAAAAERSLRAAHERLRVIVADAWRVSVGSAAVA